MKKLVISIIMFILPLTAPAAAEAQEPVDLEIMREAGLSSETLGRYLAQNLGVDRAAPPVDANLLTRLGRYGGDPLARAYLDLDKRTVHLPAREFSPEVVDQLMLSGVEPEALTKLLNDEAARYAAASSGSAIAAAGSVISGTLAPPAGDRPAEAPSAPRAPVRPVMTAKAVPPEPQVRFQNDAPRSPARPEAGFQRLRPGQAADPGSPLPLPHSTYDIRYQRMDGEVRDQRRSGVWMGVRERELPDGHVAEVNTIGDAAFMGQEVYARPSGHQVYRYFTGNPDNPRSGADPRQEQRNREDLNIIFSRDR